VLAKGRKAVLAGSGDFVSLVLGASLRDPGSRLRPEPASGFGLAVTIRSREGLRRSAAIALGPAASLLLRVRRFARRFGGVASDRRHFFVRGAPRTAKSLTRGRARPSRRPPLVSAKPFLRGLQPLARGRIRKPRGGFPVRRADGRYPSAARPSACYPGKEFFDSRLETSGHRVMAR
jgi:hypothetical protein